MIHTRLYSSGAFVCFFSMVFFSPQLPAQNHTHKTTFASKDLFGSAAFLQNKGIVEDFKGDKILYYSNRDNIHAYFTDKGVVYKVSRPEQTENAERDKTDKAIEQDKLGETGKRISRKEEHEKEPVALKTSVVTMEWVGANPNPVINTGEKRPGYYTYLKPEGGTYTTLITEGYSTITYKDLYPGIDAEYSFPEKGGMEYNLLVKPDADVSKVKMIWSQSAEIKKDDKGNLVIHTSSGDIVEHAPQSFSKDNKTVASAFSVKGKTVQFNFPQGYNASQGLIIDPWQTALTNLPPLNMGLDVDYDFNGNLFVYGAGAQNDMDTTNDFKVAKFSVSGSPLWVFNGMVPSVSWSSVYYNSATLAPIVVVPSNFIVDKQSEKVYIGQSLEDKGTQIIRLNQSGVYDNFISVADSLFKEDWGLLYKCSDASILAVGGGINSPINMGNINTTTGAVTTSNITGDLTDPQQDIVCAVYDSSGNLYVIMNDGLGVLPYTNTIYRVNNAFNGNVWSANSNFFTFNEVNNDPFWDAFPASGANGNWYNCLAANGSYLFYYDGGNLAAYSLTTGVQVGNAFTMTNFNPLLQGGIAADNCNHLYVGGTGVVSTFTFDGTNFNQGADISLGGAFLNSGVNDIKYNPSSNLLFVTGAGFAGTYTATLSTTCNTASFTVSTSGACDSVKVHISPSATLTPKIFNINWTNSSGTSISQLNNTADTVNSVSGLSTGTYYVNVQWNTSICGNNGISLFDSVSIVCSTDSLSIYNDTTICSGQSALLSAVGSPPGGTYAWTPGGASTSSITVTPGSTTTYSVTYTPLTGAPITKSVIVTVITGNPSVSVNSPSICPGANAVITATPTIPGGTYRWAPGGANTQSITVSPGSTSQYTVTYTSPQCGTATAVSTVTVNSNATVTVNNATICSGSNAVLTASPSVPGGTFSWSPGGQTTNPDTVSPATTTSYTVTYTSTCGTATATGVVTVNSNPNISVNDTSICAGGSAVLTASSTVPGGTYTWAPGGATTASITVTPLTTSQYTVTYSTPTCGSSKDTSTVTVVQSVSVIVNDSTVCLGQAAVLKALPTVFGGTYSWAPGASTLDSIIASPNSTSTYTVTYATNNCGTATNTGTVTIAPLPGLTLAVQNPLCGANTTGEIFVTPGGGTAPYQFSLDGGALQVPDSFTQLSPALDTVFVQDANGCRASDTISILPSTAVSVVLTSLNPTCGGNNGRLVGTATGGTPPYQYALNAGAFQASDTFINLATGFYTMQVKDINGCSATDTITLQQGIPLSLSLIADSVKCFGAIDGMVLALAAGGVPPFQYSLNAGPFQGIDSFRVGAGYDTVVVSDQVGCIVGAGVTVFQPTQLQFDSVIATAVKCVGDKNGTISVFASGGTTPYNYSCTKDYSNFEFATNGLITGLDTGFYSVILSDGHGCTLTDTTTVQPAIPDVYLVTTDSTSCYGSQYHDGAVHASGSPAVNAPFQYSLDSSLYQVSGDFLGLAAGLHNLNAKNYNGCLTTVPNIVVPEPKQAFASVLPADTTLRLGQSIQLTTSFWPYPSSSVVSYIWTPGLGLSCMDCPNPVLTSYTQDNDYSVTITYNDHCLVDAAVHVIVLDKPEIFIPNSFTPNGDGNNDVFLIYGENIKTLSLKIFNRWGELVFESNSQWNGWDGKYKAVLQNPAVYVYEVNITMLDDKKIFRKGSVTILR